LDKLEKKYSPIKQSQYFVQGKRKTLGVKKLIKTSINHIRLVFESNIFHFEEDKVTLAVGEDRKIKFWTTPSKLGVFTVIYYFVHTLYYRICVNLMRPPSNSNRFTSSEKLFENPRFSFGVLDFRR
jgi:hypothetical protein